MFFIQRTTSVVLKEISAIFFKDQMLCFLKSLIDYVSMKKYIQVFVSVYQTLSSGTKLNNIL